MNLYLWWFSLTLLFPDLIVQGLGEEHGNVTIGNWSPFVNCRRHFCHIFHTRRPNASAVANRISSSKAEAWVSAEGPLHILVANYLKSCSLAIFYQVETADLALTMRQNLPYQGVKMYLLSPYELMEEATWIRSHCDGYIFLLTGKGDALVHHASIDNFKAVPYKPGHRPPALWNYKAYYVILLLQPSSLLPLDLIRLYNFKKTENMAILQETREQLLMWTHSLLSRTPRLVFLDSWIDGRFRNGRNPFPKKFENFKGAPLRVATFEHPPSVVYARDQHGNVVSRIGVDMEIIRGLSKVKNFTIELVEVSFIEKWGRKFENGSWDGLMREVYDELSDIGVCNVFIDYYRYGEMDYSYPYNFMPGCFVTPSPKPLSNWQSPTLPFTSDTWISIGLSFLMGGPLLYFILLSTMKIKSESADFKSLTYNYLFILASLTVRSVYIVPNHWPGRLYSGFVWIFCLIISTGYSANLVAFLSVTKMSKPIDTLSEFVNSGLGLGGHSFWKAQFELSPGKIYLKLASIIETDVDYVAIFDQVEAGKFAFVENKQYLELNRDARYTYGGHSTIRIVKEYFLSYNVALTLPRNSPLTENLSKDLMRIFESGLMRKWQDEVIQYFRKQYASKRQGRKYPDPSENKPLNLGHVQGMFYIIFIGYILAVLLLLMEMVIFRKAKKPVETH